MPDLDETAARVRRFNRFYTREIGVLNEGFLDSRFSLAEGRVLFEIASSGNPTAARVSQELGLDPGYASRILAGFRKGGLVSTSPSEADGRERILRLTPKGRKELSILNRRAQDQIRGKLVRLSPAQQQDLTQCLDKVEGMLGATAASPEPHLLRTHQPGDMGWVVFRHGVLYAQEYGLDESFEALVAGIVAEFVRKYDASRERCWIAERGGERVGSVFLVRKTDRVAKLRLLLVEPSARGLGIGRRLVSECVRFAEQAGYRKVTLWTNRILDAARHIYEETGFQRVKEEQRHVFGKDLIFETWDLNIRRPTTAP